MPNPNDSKNINGKEEKYMAYGLQMEGKPWCDLGRTCRNWDSASSLCQTKISSCFEWFPIGLSDKIDSD